MLALVGGAESFFYCKCFQSVVTDFHFRLKYFLWHALLFNNFCKQTYATGSNAIKETLIVFFFSSTVTWT